MPGAVGIQRLVKAHLCSPESCGVTRSMEQETGLRDEIKHACGEEAWQTTVRHTGPSLPFHLELGLRREMQ